MNLKLNDKSNQVREWQEFLNRFQNENLDADGEFGPKTHQATIRFQVSQNLRDDGIVGPNTYLAAVRHGFVGGGTSKALIDKPWFNLAITKKGLHERSDIDELKKFLKADGKTLGDPSKLPWCFAGEVEILTDDGWQRFDRLSAGRVWQVDEAGNASLTEYLPVEKDYDDEAYLIEGATFQGVCDKNHQWWGSWGYETRQRIESPNRKGTLDNLTTAGLRLPTVQTEAEGVDLDDKRLVMIAAFISDGSIHRGKLQFEVFRERKIAALTDLQPEYVYQQRKVYGPLTKTPLTVFTFPIPDWQDTVFSEYKRLSRDFVNNLSQRQCRRFLTAYANFDGNMRDDGRITLYTSDDQTRDDLIQLIAMAGWWPRVEKGGRSELTKKASWRIGFVTTDGIRKRIRKQDVSGIPFKGRMYCVTVPNGRIIVRGRNMTPVVTGNCGDFVETCIGLTLRDEPLPANPYLARNWAKFGQPVERTLGAVLVFWRGSRNGSQGHVGFYTGESTDGKRVYVLGGNQSDAITVAPLGADRLLDVRWPKTVAIPSRPERPVMIGGKLSINEA